MQPHADRGQAEQDLNFITEVVRRTHARVDPHMFHFVHWGTLVLVWFPVGNWLQNSGRLRELAGLSIGAVLVGITLSCVREIRLSNKPRLQGDNTFVTRQLSIVTLGCVAPGMILSLLAPSFSFIAGENIPILWGLIYANLTFMTGVIYARELLWAAVAIFVGVVLAIVFQQFNGYILGPFMGISMIIPGLRGEARVKRLVAELS